MGEVMDELVPIIAIICTMACQLSPGGSWDYNGSKVAMPKEWVSLTRGLSHPRVPKRNRIQTVLFH